VNTKRSWIRLIHGALAGTLFLAGCPSAGDFEDATPVAGMTVEGLGGRSAGCAAPANKDALVARVVELVNQERTKRGLNPVTLNPTLCRIADDYACEMITKGFFDHTDPDGLGPGQRAINAGYIFLAIGENLAGGQNSPEQAMKEWMNSKEGHRENILAPQWREIGVAVRLGGIYGIYWVQEFGNPP
jgi:uncharacterized protein YkwD